MKRGGSDGSGPQIIAREPICCRGMLVFACDFLRHRLHHLVRRKRCEDAMLSIPLSQLSPHHLGGDRVISLPEAAARAGVSVATLKRCGKRGELKVLRLSPRRIGIRLSDLEAFLASRAG